MKNHILINKKIASFNKKIQVSGDKSLSIRLVLLASQAIGKSKIYNLLDSEDVNHAIKCIKRLGINVKNYKKYCEIFGKGLNGFEYKKNLTLNAGNSGTLARLILGLLTHSNKKIKIIGDKSLSKRDFGRIIEPLKKFGANFYTNKKKTLPLIISGTNFTRPINYVEKRGSAQCKSSVMLAALNTKGKTTIKAKKSRNHTELLFKELGIPTKIKKYKNYDFIEINGGKRFESINYSIPSDISSSSFFIALTLLSKNSSLKIKNVNINPSRSGVISILNLMGAKIKVINKKKYKGELTADIIIKSAKKLKGIVCPTKYNANAIDEFLIIFLIASKSKGVSYFKNLSELNKKESKRLNIASKILTFMGVKNQLKNNSIKIFGDPNLELNSNFLIKNFMKDHRIFMMCTIAALTLGGNWKIKDKSSINSSFPKFLSILKNIGAKIN